MAITGSYDLPTFHGVETNFDRFKEIEKKMPPIGSFIKGTFWSKCQVQNIFRIIDTRVISFSTKNSSQQIHSCH